MEMEAGGRCSSLLKSAGVHPEEVAAAVTAEGHAAELAAEEQEPQLPLADEAAVNHRISDLPDGLLGEIISLLPEKRKSAGFNSIEAAKPLPPAAEEYGAAAQNLPPLPVADGGAANFLISHLADDIISLLPANDRMSKRRKSAGLESPEAAKPLPLAAEEHVPEPAAAAENLPLLPVADGGTGNDRISNLPDAVLGDIISHLPTREGARTPALASRWRYLWRSAPLNLDYEGLCQDLKKLSAVVPDILSAHLGPARRFSAPVYHLHGNRAATADAWLASPVLRNLEEIELRNFLPGLPYQFVRTPPSAAAAFRFSETLCVAIIGNCKIPELTDQPIAFPRLKKLQLEWVTISEPSLHNLVAGCFSLQFLLIAYCSGLSCLQINSNSITSICVKCGAPPLKGLWFHELSIRNAPCLKMLLLLGSMQTSVISVPKLHTLGCLSSSSSLRLGSTTIEGLYADNLMSVVRTIKVLDIDLNAHNLHATIEFIRCFPCLERLYVENIESSGPAEAKPWSCKHRDFPISV